MAEFTVDTHLFRELGELLVGRDSTALVELIKNAYDADATKVVVYGEALDDIERGFIRITDNGTGMTPDAFTKGFLRIAARAKEQERRSHRYQRRYTGAKGVGRLAAHKLARFIQIESTPSLKKRTKEGEGVEASIDWDLVEEKETLDELKDTDAISRNTFPVSPRSKSGTTITLSRLRRPWSSNERGKFISEVRTFQPALALIKPLLKSVVSKKLLFERPQVRDSSAPDEGFIVSLEGDFETGDDFWQTLIEATDWIIEIDANKKDKKVHYCIVPTKKIEKELPEAEKRIYTIPHMNPKYGPFFQSRILIQEGQLDRKVTAWSRQTAGIRVFLEGFRVLPYGELKNDWLALDSDYVKRERILDRLQDIIFSKIPLADEDEGLLGLPNRAYFGAVFLTQEYASSLRILVNREGFIPDIGLEILTDIVRTGIDLSTRIRAAAKHTIRSKRKEERASKRAEENGNLPTDMAIDKVPAEQLVSASVERVQTLAKEAVELIVKGNLESAQAKVTEVINESQTFSDVSQDFISERAMLRVLASAGMQLAAFVHEINGLVGMAQSLDNSLSKLRDDPKFERGQKRKLARIQGSIGDLRRGLERQASYLLDIVTPDARRRRSRQDLLERFESGSRLLEHIAQRRSIKIINKIPKNFKSPPMFPAELTTLFANLLTNAVKAAGEKGRIQATGKQNRNGSRVLTIENTGEAVEPEKGEYWFRPFESTTSQVDPILGQGMGLGLPITRSMLEEYGAEIHFTRPSAGFSTAIEIVFPSEN